ncbi:MAG: FMN-binding protein [Planctomycetota bacterium]
MTDNSESGTTKNQLARKVVLYSAVLMGVCLVSAAGVSVLYVTNRGRIQQNQMKSFRQSLSVVLGDADDAQPLDEETPVNEADVLVAPMDDGVRYVVRGSARGYQSVIEVLVSIDADSADSPLNSDPTIHRVAVVSSQETPGLGENINKVEKDVSLWAAMLGRGNGDGNDRPWFQAQFNGKRLSDLEVRKEDDSGIEPITGATITSRGTTEAVRNAAETLIEKTRELYAD